MRAPALPWATETQERGLPDPGVVDLWRIDLVRSAEEVARAAVLLSPEEIDRAERYRYERHRGRFVLGRAALREILAGYCGRAPAELRFELEAAGRPVLADGAGLVFSYAKTNAIALLAVAREARLGVDIEDVVEKPDLALIVADQYSPDERIQIERLPPDSRLEAFYRGWTAREALVKATGEGLTSLLPKMTIDLEPSGPARLTAGPAPYDPGVWRLAVFAAAPGVLGAVALDRPLSALKAIVR